MDPVLGWNSSEIWLVLGIHSILVLKKFQDILETEFGCIGSIWRRLRAINYSSFELKTFFPLLGLWFVCECYQIVALQMPSTTEESSNSRLHTTPVSSKMSLQRDSERKCSKGLGCRTSKYPGVQYTVMIGILVCSASGQWLRFAGVPKFSKLLWSPRIRVVRWGTTLEAGSSPVRVQDEVDFFNLPNPSSRTMVLGSTQPLT
jgi:hypothetical protein